MTETLVSATAEISILHSYCRVLLTHHLPSSTLIQYPHLTARATTLLASAGLVVEEEEEGRGAARALSGCFKRQCGSKRSSRVRTRAWEAAWEAALGASPLSLYSPDNPKSDSLLPG